MSSHLFSGTSQRRPRQRPFASTTIRTFLLRPLQPLKAHLSNTTESIYSNEEEDDSSSHNTNPLFPHQIHTDIRTDHDDAGKIQLPPANPKIQQHDNDAAIRKTTELMHRINLIQESLARIEVAGEAGGRAESPPPDVPSPFFHTQKTTTFQNKHPPLPGVYTTPLGYVVGEKDDALVRVVYSGTGHPLRVELNHECMQLDKQTLERYIVQAMWHGWAKAGVVMRNKHAEINQREGLPPSFQSPS